MSALLLADCRHRQLLFCVLQAGVQTVVLPVLQGPPTLVMPDLDKLALDWSA